MYGTMSKEHFYFIVTTSDHGNLNYTCTHYVLLFVCALQAQCTDGAFVLPMQ